MIVVIFSFVLILCFEIFIFFNIPIFFSNQIKLYKTIFKQLNNEDVYLDLSVKILINSIKLFFLFLISTIPILLFFFLIKLNGVNVFEFMLSLYNISISILVFFIYFFARKKIVKR